MTAALAAVVPLWRDSLPGAQLGDATPTRTVGIGYARADSCQQTGPPVTPPLARGRIGSRRMPSARITLLLVGAVLATVRFRGLRCLSVRSPNLERRVAGAANNVSLDRRRGQRCVLHNPRKYRQHVLQRASHGR